MRRLVVIVVLVAVAAFAGLYAAGYRTEDALALWRARDTQAAAQGSAPPAGSRRGGRRNPVDPDLPVPVLTAKAGRKDVPIYLDALGTVQAFNTMQVRPQIEGPLVEVAFREGQDVKKGDLLARIDPRPYQAALDSAVAKKQQDEATLANNRLDAARYAKLAATAFSSAQQADTARSAVAQMEAQVRGDQAQIDTAKTQLDYTRITAAFDGRTGLRQVDAGNIVHQTDANPITVLTQLQPISVVFTLPQQALPMVSTAMEGGMPEVLAMRAGPGGAVLDTGQLAVLDNQVDPATGTIKLKATFPNAGLRLWPGGFVNVRLLAKTEPQVVTVPPAAVQRGPRGTYVFVVQGDQTVKRETVKVGHEDEQVSVIEDGLKDGDQVVVDGAQRLNDNSKVAVAGPDGNAPAAAPRERKAPGTAQRAGRRNAS